MASDEADTNAQGGSSKAKPGLMRQGSGLMDTVKNVQANFEKAWTKLRPYYDAAQPYLEMVKPYAKKAYLLALDAIRLFKTNVLPYCDRDVNQIIFAVVLLFFGGNFAMTVACVQAFHMVGWKNMHKSWEQLKESFDEAVEILDKDAEAKKLFNLEGTNTIEVTEIFEVIKQIAAAEKPSEKELAKKKLNVLMRCVDPNKILDASKGLWIGIVAVISTLRSRLAYCVSLGASIGHSICDFLKLHVQRFLYDAFPTQKKWVDFTLRSGCGLLGILISLALTRVVCAVASALQGASLLTKVFFQYIHTGEATFQSRRSSIGKILFENPSIGKNLKKLDSHEALFQYSLVVVGLLFQFWTRYRLPFLLWLPLSPLYMVENILSILAVG